MSLQLTYCLGGMDECQRTGTYPRKILVYDQVLNKRWRRKITEEKNSGELKIENNIIYKYHVNIKLHYIRIFDHNGNLINDCLINMILSD